MLIRNMVVNVKGRSGEVSDRSAHMLFKTVRKAILLQSDKELS